MSSLIRGVNVQLGLKKLVLPPFSLSIMFAHEELIKELQDPSKLSLIEYVKKALPLLLETFQRNYPDMTEADFLADVDPGSVMELLEMSFAQSGFVPLTAGVPAAAAPEETPQEKK